MFRILAAGLLLASPVVANGNDGDVVVDRPMDLVSGQMAAFPESLEGRPNLSLVSRKRDDGRLLVQLTETGFLDDSVEGARETYVLEPTDDGRWKVVETRQEVRCYRGADPKKWQTGNCP